MLVIPCVGLAKPRTYDEIIQSKELKICYPLWIGKDSLADFPSPYMEMAVAFAKKKNLEPKLKLIAWSDQFLNADGKVMQGETYTPALFDKQECDLFASNISPLEWRKKLMDLNWIYISTMTVVVRKEDKKKYKKPEDLKGKTVYVMPNSTYHQWLLQYQETLKDSEKIKIIEAPEGGTVAYLLDKKADFIIYESQNALYAKHNISDAVTIAFSLGKALESGWGFPKGSEKMKSDILEFFEQQKNDPKSTVNDIYKKYLGLTLIDYEKLQYTLVAN